MASKKNSLAPTNQIHNTNTVTARYTEITSGPLPSAHELVQYEQATSGAADRIIKMAENQSAHRQEIEKKVISANTRDSKLGVIFAFTLGMSTLVCGTIVILSGYEWPGTLIGSSGLIGLTSVFIYGTRSSRKERANKEKRIINN